MNFAYRCDSINLKSRPPKTFHGFNFLANKAPIKVWFKMCDPHKTTQSDLNH